MTPHANLAARLEHLADTIERGPLTAPEARSYAVKIVRRAAGLLTPPAGGAGTEGPRAAPGPWPMTHHRSMAEVLAAEEAAGACERRPCAWPNCGCEVDDP